MIAALGEVLSGMGLSGGLWAIVTWVKGRKRNGNGHGSPSEPPLAEAQNIMISQGLYQLNQEYKQALLNVTGTLEKIAETQAHPLVIREQPDPAWVAALETRLAALQTPQPPEETQWRQESVAAIERVAERLDAIAEAAKKPPPPPAPPPDPPPLPAEYRKAFEELPDKIAQAQEAGARRAVAAAKQGNNPHPPRSEREPIQPRAIPNPLPPIPSIPPSYVGGSVNIPGGGPQNLLVLIQQQLQPNCPGSCVQLRLSADSEVFVGAASFYGGPLSATNYAYVLEAGEEKLYHSSFPGSSCPLGDLQVLGSGPINVEVQL